MASIICQHQKTIYIKQLPILQLIKTFVVKNILIVLSLFLVLSTCSKEDDGLNGGLFGTTGTITAKIDGKNFSSKLGTATVSDLTNSVQQVFISGFDQLGTVQSDFVEIAIYFPETIDLGTKSYDGTGDSCDFIDQVCVQVGYFAVNNSDTDVSFNSLDDDGNSTVSISSLNLQSGGRIKGSFSATLVEEDSGEVVSLSNGQFDVPVN